MNRWFVISSVDWTSTRSEKRRSIGFRVTRTTFLQGPGSQYGIRFATWSTSTNCTETSFVEMTIRVRLQGVLIPHLKEIFADTQAITVRALDTFTYKIAHKSRFCSPNLTISKSPESNET